MKFLLILSHWLLLFQLQSSAQKLLYDKHIVHQQERMVHKQWDRDKFTPKKGFLGLNPNYWLTWAWHPNYPDKDRRPLGPVGMQTQRLGMVVAMQHASKAYKLHTDTLQNIAVSELLNYAGPAARADPLWLLYYRHELEGLLKEKIFPDGLRARVRQYLLKGGIYDWYRQARLTLRERLKGARNTKLDRGGRILTYHRLMLEYRNLRARWESAIRNAESFLTLVEQRNQLRGRVGGEIKVAPGRTDVEIADDILARSKL